MLFRRHALSPDSRGSDRRQIQILVPLLLSIYFSLHRFITRQVAPFFIDSCEGAGIRLTSDFNKPGGREGAGYYHFAVREGVRDSAARAMLGDIVMGRDVRTNLDIVTGALVTKVVVDGDPAVRQGDMWFVFANGLARISKTTLGDPIERSCKQPTTLFPGLVPQFMRRQT